MNENYWLSEATRLQAALELERSKNERLIQYESMVHYIANDYYELSYDKAKWQRDDWHRRCRKLIASMESDDDQPTTR